LTHKDEHLANKNALKFNFMILRTTISVV